MNYTTQTTAAAEGVETPIEVNLSSLPTVLASIGRILVILIGGFGTLMSLLSAKDVAGLWVWFQSADGAGFIAALTAGGTLAASIWKTIQRHRKLVVVATKVDDSVAKVVAK